MGWKSVKEHYRISHHVQVRDGDICIGSGYISEIIVIGSDGRIKKRSDELSNVELRRYLSEMDADVGKLKELVEMPDVFERSIPVYTYAGGDILEKRCETLGWPNVTHDGMMMYENTFSDDRDKVIGWATRNAELAIKNTEERIVDMEGELVKLNNRLAEYKDDFEKLLALSGDKS